MDNKCNCSKPTYEELESHCKDLEEELNYKISLINALQDALIREHVTSDHYKFTSKDYSKYWTNERKRANELFNKIDEQENLLIECKKLINDLEPTFNHKGIADENSTNIGTIIRYYFIDNSSEKFQEFLNRREEDE